MVVSKSSRTRLPEVAFKQYVRDDVVLPEEPARKFNLKREVFSLDFESARSADYRTGLRNTHSFDHGSNLDSVRTQPAKSYPSQWSAPAESAVTAPSIQYDKSQCTCRCCFATCGEHATCRNQNRGILRVQRIHKVINLFHSMLLCHC